MDSFLTKMAKPNQFPVLLMQFPTIPDFPRTSDTYLAHLYISIHLS